MNTRKPKGFSLIELLIAVAIVGILAAIAYPSYVDQVRKSRRTEAQDLLMDIAQREERFYAQNATYTNDLTVLNYSVASNLPTENGHYQVSITSATATNYTIEATPQGDQAKDRIQGLRIDATGKKDAKVGGAWANGWSHY